MVKVSDKNNYSVGKANSFINRRSMPKYTAQDKPQIPASKDSTDQQANRDITLPPTAQQQNQQSQQNISDRERLIEEELAKYENKDASPKPGSKKDNQQIEQKKEYQKVKGGLKHVNMIIIAVAIVVILAAGAYLLLGSQKHHGSTTTSTIGASSSITNGLSLSVSACGVISSPGSYSLSSDIKTKITSGSCINITSSNVALECTNRNITGSGPFGGIPPFSYGIYINRVNNVSIDNCNIGNFSYGIFAQQSSKLRILDNKLVPNYVSNLYIANVTNSTIDNNYMSRSSSQQGSIYIAQGSFNNKIANNFIDYNQFYGININSSNNTFINNTVNHTTDSFYCSPGNGFVYSSLAHSNVCYNNYGCDFEYCKGTNTPANISAIHLSRIVMGCGSIYSSGAYSIAKNISMAQYLNTSNPLLDEQNVSCITIRSNNVIIECNNYTLSNSTIGIYSQGVSNLTIDGCKLSNDDRGIVILNDNLVYINNTLERNVNNSVELYNASGTLINNIKTQGGSYGIHLINNQGDTIENFNITYAKYGIYLNNSLGNDFNNGMVYNSTKIDVYATSDSSGTQDNIMLLTGCGVTNADWAQCKYHLVTSLAEIPINACSTIEISGRYLLSSNIINASSGCMSINVNNVSLSCNGHIIEPTSSYVKTVGVQIMDVENVSFDGCDLENFYTGVNISNSTYINITNMTIFKSSTGIAATNSKFINISYNNVSSYAAQGISILKVTNSSIIGNKVAYTPSQGIGISIENSRYNNITNNTGTENYIGIKFNQSSINNTVSNNTMQLSQYKDYVCDGTDDNLSSEYGGIDYGTDKINCEWMAALPQTSIETGCQSILSPDQITMSLDSIYNYGAFCFRVSANDTKIDCNGHTVISTDGGIFLIVDGGHSITIQNCYLKGFTSAIEVFNATATVLNNTVYGISKTIGTGIETDYSNHTVISNNHVSNVAYAYYINDSSYGSLSNNFAGTSNVSYSLYNSNSISILNNTASNYVSLGVLFYNSLNNIFTQNRLSSDGGIICKLSSAVLSADQDGGQNICKSNANCLWITQSSNSCT